MESTKPERYDDPEVLDKKIKLLCNLVKEANHLVIFTGAGISTDGLVQS